MFESDFDERIKIWFQHFAMLRPLPIAAEASRRKINLPLQNGSSLTRYWRRRPLRTARTR